VEQKVFLGEGSVMKVSTKLIVFLVENNFLTGKGEYRFYHHLLELIFVVFATNVFYDLF